ncbi:hypothetical protein [Actinoplanes aureus]|uniref:Uncharacterized protein n=1 Tax=Actinoplanes aureus TaxID=2792083 RepID=A0A931CI37_9ACTN|nr:hypothetical protein [Actinoplanes aureus]MBG0568412.1 hypothetical protein [Actinoplanes aureus]
MEWLVMDEPRQDDDVAAVCIGGNSEAEVFNRAAQWIAKNDGSVEIQALHWQRVSRQPYPGRPVFEMHIYFEPQ